jgi:Putative prokaryotic signal transducing protein
MMVYIEWIKTESNPMRKIYENFEFARVGHFQSILESVGIQTHLMNVGASASAGDIPFQQVFPELWVVDDSQYELALETLRPYYCHEFEDGPPWTCPSCKESIEGTFNECWNCQAERPENE